MNSEEKQPTYQELISFFQKIHTQLEKLNGKIESLDQKVNQIEERMVTHLHLQELQHKLNERMDQSDMAIASATEILGESLEEVIRNHEKRLVTQLKLIMLSSKEINDLKQILDGMMELDDTDEDHRLSDEN